MGGVVVVMCVCAGGRVCVWWWCGGGVVVVWWCGGGGGPPGVRPWLLDGVGWLLAVPPTETAYKTGSPESSTTLHQSPWGCQLQPAPKNKRPGDTHLSMFYLYLLSLICNSYV